MYYETESRRFKNRLDENIVYGWRNDIGTEQTMFHSDSNSTLPFDASTEEALPF
jgi:hypothetical protein